MATRCGSCDKGAKIWLKRVSNEQFIVDTIMSIVLPDIGQFDQLVAEFF